MFWKKLKKKAAEKHNYDLTYDNVAIPEVHTHKPEDHEETPGEDAPVHYDNVAIPEAFCKLCSNASVVGVHFQNRYIVVGQMRNYAFQLPFSLIFSKTFSLSSQLQNIDKKGNYKAVDKIRK